MKALLSLRIAATALLAAVTLTLVVPVTTSAQTVSRPEFKLFILRKVFNGRCTLGYLGAQSPTRPAAIIAYTMERPWRNNQQNISSIPSGTYPAIVRYDKPDHWRIQLLNVPGRSGIQIHVGNEPDQSKGCILVGDGVDASHCQLFNSRVAYARLKRNLYGTDHPRSSPDMKITVIVTKPF